MNPTPYLAVVDDDASVIKALRRILKPLGLSLRTFASSEEFARAVAQQEPEVLILDVWMPGLSGLELQELLLSQKRRIPIVFITAHDDEAARLRALARGALGFISKPFDKRLLLDLVAKACGTRPPAATATLRLHARGTPREQPVVRDDPVPAGFELADLRPCPFCRAYPRSDQRRWRDAEGRDRHSARIFCPGCDAAVQSDAEQTFTTPAAAQADAARRWNRRTSLPLQELL